jgi:hypothetical protein
MKAVVPRFTRHRRVLLAALAIALLAAVLVLLLGLRPRLAAAPTPGVRIPIDAHLPVPGVQFPGAKGAATVEELHRRVVHALEAGDATALCALAHPEERFDLNLNPASVTAFLKEDLWARGQPRCTLSERFWEYSDAAIWTVGFSDAPPPAVFHLEMYREQSGWWLTLSAMLRSICLRGRAMPAGIRLHGRLAEKHGIKGVLSSLQTGEYFAIDAARARASAARLAAQMGENFRQGGPSPGEYNLTRTSFRKPRSRHWTVR